MIFSGAQKVYRMSNNASNETIKGGKSKYQ